MTVLFIILGIMMIACGFSCMFTPLLTFMQVGYFVVILMAVFGIAGIIRAIADKKFGVNFAFSILSVILGVVMMAFPESLLFAQSVMLIIEAIWFIVLGIITIRAAIMVKKSGSKVWIAELIFGILAILIGCYACFHPMVMALSIGMLIGISFIETGFTLIFSGIASDN